MKKSSASRESPAVERVRTARRALAKDCNCDVDELGRVLMERQRKSKHTFAVPAKKATRV